MIKLFYTFLFTILFSLSTNYCRAQISFKEIVDLIEAEKEIICVDLNFSADSLKYSFLNELRRDELIGDQIEIEPKYSIFNKKERPFSREFDFLLEQWVIEDLRDRDSIKNLLGEVLYDSFYEKPPKVVLSFGDVIYIISTWGAVYREDLYGIRELLVKKYQMDIY